MGRQPFDRIPEIEAVPALHEREHITVRTAGEAMKVVAFLCPLIKIERGIAIVMERAERLARSRLFSIHLNPSAVARRRCRFLNYFPNIGILPRFQCQYPLNLSP
jgi:hypothetical protein